MSRDDRPPIGRESRGSGDDDSSVGVDPVGSAEASSAPGVEKVDGVDRPGFPDREASSAPVWVRLTGAGMELAFITIVFGAIGILIDRHFNLARPIYSAAGGMLGFTFGMVRFIRMATQVSQAQRTIESTRSFDASSRSGVRSSHDEKDGLPAEVHEETDGLTSGDREST